MRLIPYSAIWDKILLPVLCCASFSGSKDLEERIGKCFLFSFFIQFRGLSRPNEGSAF